MKICSILILLIFSLTSCSFAGNKIPKEPEKKSVKEKVEALTNEDPRRQQIMALTWQIQCYKEQLKTMELSHMIKCYQSKIYRDTLAKIEELNKQIRVMMLL